MKIAFGMIVFNGNHVLEECLKSVYEFAEQILIAEGPVQYWQDQGYTTSTDGTNEVLGGFPDPDRKITLLHSQYKEKNEQCNAYIPFMKPNIDYLWNLDSDEIFKPEDIETIIKLIKQNKFTSVGFKSLTFYGGFDHYLTGFEESAEFIRIKKVYPGSYWRTHRPPTIAHRTQPTMSERHLKMDVLASVFNVRMYHYSYVFPQQVLQKWQYYKSAVGAPDWQIDDYFNQVYLPWVKGDNREKQIVEDKYRGVHEWKPQHRGDCRTIPFKGEHPVIIQQNMDKLQRKFYRQLNELEKC